MKIREKGLLLSHLLLSPHIRQSYSGNIFAEFSGLPGIMRKQSDDTGFFGYNHVG